MYEIRRKKRWDYIPQRTLSGRKETGLALLIYLEEVGKWAKESVESSMAEGLSRKVANEIVLEILAENT